MANDIVPSNFRLSGRVQSDRRLIVPFDNGEILLGHSIAHQIEFLNGRCNLTLKNSSDKKHSLNVVVRVLNRALIEIWTQSEKWVMQSLASGQVHSCSWPFVPAVPDCVWNEKARETVPAWIMVDVL